MNIATLIERASFDEHEIDTGISGLCGMFALALWRTLRRHDVAADLALVCPQGATGARRCADGCLEWHHAIVIAQGRLYDIEGEQKADWLRGNHLGNAVYGIAMPVVTYREFIREMRAVGSAWDWRFYIACRRRSEAVLAPALNMTCETGSTS